MINDLPGNSRQSRINAERTTNTPEPKIERVVTGRVTIQKKSLGRRLREAFFSTDSTSIVGYLLIDVLVPAVKNIVRDVALQGIDKAFNIPSNYQGSMTRIPYGSPAPPTPYDAYSRPTTIVRSAPPTLNVTHTPPYRQPVAPQRSSAAIGDIILESHIEAEVVTEKLLDVIRDYGIVTVADLFSSIGQSSTPTDHNWGWDNLSMMQIKRVANGFLLVLPDPRPIR